MGMKTYIPRSWGGSINHDERGVSSRNGKMAGQDLLRTDLRICRGGMRTLALWAVAVLTAVPMASTTPGQVGSYRYSCFCNRCKPASAGVRLPRAECGRPLL